MSRTLASIEALLLAAALTACGSKSTSTPIDHAGGVTDGTALAVTLADAGEEGSEEGSSWTRTLVAADAGHFPAVSADGTTVVDLVVDAEDFSGIPIATVVFWTRAGKLASFQLASQFAEEAPTDQAAKEEAAVTQINAKLAETTWRPLDKVSATGESEDTGAPDTLDLGDGVTLTLAQLHDKFPSPGDMSSEMGGGGCGDVIGLSEGFGGKALGFAVVYPRANLGGDDCFGTPTADLAIVVAVP